MFGFGILSGLTFLPLVGVAFMLTQKGDDEATLRNVRWATLADDDRRLSPCRSSCGQRFDTTSAAFQLVEEKGWFGSGLVYKMGVDGFSMPFVLLTTFLMPFAILASWESITFRVKEYMIAFLVLETLMIGVFCALDLVLFYLFFEGGLIPMFLIIGIWGGKRRVYASFKFFLYTLVGSLLMLIAILAMYGKAGTTDITVLLKTNFPPDMQTMAVARLLRLLRGEDADVAGAHLAARRSRRGADRGLGDPGGDPVEDGRLWLHPLLAADVPGRLGYFRAAHLCAVRHRHRLHLARRAGAGGHQEAHRLFVGRAYGLRHHGPVHPERRRACRARCS